LLAQGGLYARLRAHQSGGFLGDALDEGMRSIDDTTQSANVDLMSCGTGIGQRGSAGIFQSNSASFHQMTFAVGEALAHLHLLWLAGELERVEGRDGVVRFGR
jgi:hypothetical protein